MSKQYTIEFVTWTSCKVRFVGKFRTQKAARAFLERNGFTPYFKSARPSLYHSPRDRYGRSGMQATVKEIGNWMWINSSAEGRMRDGLLTAKYN